MASHIQARRGAMHSRRNRLKSPSSTRTGGFLNVFFLGFLAGVVSSSIFFFSYSSMMQSLITLEEGLPMNSNTSLFPANERNRKESMRLPVVDGFDRGWHPIYVYYGENTNSLPVQSSLLSVQYPAGSQVDQDKVVNGLIETFRRKQSLWSQLDNPAPFFVDLAANDAIQLSNTYDLEKRGWKGLCVEPNSIYWYRLSHRNCAVAAAFVGGKEDLQLVDVTLNNEAFGGIIGEGMDNSMSKNPHDKTVGNKAEKRYTVSIATLFREFNVPTVIDYLSLDVEGAEGLIMEDFPFDTFLVRVLTVERPKLELQELLTNKGYVYVMNLVFWGETLYVHKSFTEVISIEKIKDYVHSVSRFSSVKAKRGQLSFDITTAKYEKVK